MRKAERSLAAIQACRDDELAQMRRDMVDNRHGFADKCRGFVFKHKACRTPERLVAPWARTKQAQAVE